MVLRSSTGGILTLDNGSNNAVISNSGTGALSIGSVGAEVAVSLQSSLTVTNTGSNFLGFLGGLSAGSAGLKTVTFGPSTGVINMSSTFSDGSGQIAVVVNSGAGTVTAQAGQAFTGGLTINSGEYMAYTAAGATAFGAGTVTVNGGKLRIQQTTAVTYANGIILNAASTEINTSAATTNSTFGGIISGDGGLNVTGAGKLTLTANNTFEGGVKVTAGTVATDATGTLGLGNVEVVDGQILTLGNKFSIDSEATLTFGNTSVINLNYATGTDMTISGLSLGAISIENGTYTVAQLNDFFDDYNGGSAFDNFTGTGGITVVPEPGAARMVLIASMALATLVWRKKTSCIQ